MMPWAVSAPSPVIAHDIDLSKERVLICTPTRSRDVGDNYRRCVDQLRCKLREQVLPLDSIPPHRDGEQDRLLAVELIDSMDAWVLGTGVLAQPHDLARTRDRMLRFFVERTNATWMLFWDDDVWCRQPHVALANMLTASKLNDVHVVGALYPRKQRDEQKIIEAVRVGKPNPLQHGFTIEDMRMWKRKDFSPKTPHQWLMTVNGIGFGFCLISREAAIAMTERFRVSMSWNDHLLGKQTVGLCQQILDGFESYSEDYSFCIRAEQSGFDVVAYIGPESPMIHDGHESYEASPECFGYLKGVSK